LEHLLRAEEQQLSGEPSRTSGRERDLVERMTDLLRVRVEIAERERAVAGDRKQHVVEIMGNSTNETPYDLHTLWASQLLIAHKQRIVGLFTFPERAPKRVSLAARPRYQPEGEEREPKSRQRCDQSADHRDDPRVGGRSRCGLLTCSLLLKAKIVKSKQRNDYRFLVAANSIEHRRPVASRAACRACARKHDKQTRVGRLGLVHERLFGSSGVKAVRHVGERFSQDHDLSLNVGSVRDAELVDCLPLVPKIAVASPARAPSAPSVSPAAAFERACSYCRTVNPNAQTIAKLLSTNAAPIG
jgi:hypothetical protein